MRQLIESPLLYAGRSFYGPKTTNWRDSSTSIFIRNFSPLCFEKYSRSIRISQSFLKYSDCIKLSNPTEPQISIKLFTGLVGKWQQMRYSFSNLEPQFLFPILALPNHHSGLWVTNCNCSWCLFMGLWVAMQLFFTKEAIYLDRNAVVYSLFLYTFFVKIKIKLYWQIQHLWL